MFPNSFTAWRHRRLKIPLEGSQEGRDPGQNPSKDNHQYQTNDPRKGVPQVQDWMGSGNPGSRGASLGQSKLHCSGWSIRPPTRSGRLRNNLSAKTRFARWMKNAGPGTQPERRESLRQPKPSTAPKRKPNWLPELIWLPELTYFNFTCDYIILHFNNYVL